MMAAAIASLMCCIGLIDCTVRQGHGRRHVNSKGKQFDIKKRAGLAGVITSGRLPLARLTRRGRQRPPAAGLPPSKGGGAFPTPTPSAGPVRQGWGMDHKRHGRATSSGSTSTPTPPAMGQARGGMGTATGGNVRQASGMKHGNRAGKPAGNGRQRPQTDSGGGVCSISIEP